MNAALFKFYIQMWFPILGTATAFTLWSTLGWAPGPIEWVLFGSLFVLTNLSHSMGVHRYFSHRAFETGPFIRYSLAILANMAGHITVRGYCLFHRYHHIVSDQPGDHQSPRLFGNKLLPSWWHAQYGWHILIRRRDTLLNPDPREDNVDLIADLLKDPWLRKIDNMTDQLVWMGWIIPGAISFAYYGTFQAAIMGTLWGGAVRMLAVWTCIDTISWAGHMYGSQTYASDDTSTNSFIIALLTLGDGWHNNHHAFPTSCRHGFTWAQLDITYLIIICLEKVGLVWNVRRLPASIIETKLQSPARKNAA